MTIKLADYITDTKNVFTEQEARKIYIDAGYKEVVTKKFMGKWYLEVSIDGLGSVMLLDKKSELPIAVVFETQDDAIKYLEENY